MSQQDIVATFREKLEASPFVMAGLIDGKHSEPLAAQIDHDRPNTLYFFTGRDNRIAGGGQAMVQFVGKGHDFFACLAGTITRDDSRAEVDKLWSKSVEAWFPNGKDDPNLTLLRFDISSAELWETDISVSGRLKMLFGGTIDASESSTHAKVENVG
jgi:general stress protein 26